MRGRVQLAVIAAGSCVAVAQAQFVRPNGAAATSEFSSLYTAGNAINGSGLPVGFGPNSAHADYATNNHWTTATNQTIGQSATFTFTTPRTLGAFHMWAHRSNNIASNPDYEVTLFDLVFRNSASSTIATFSNVSALPNVAVAQTYALPRIDNVASVQFIVRATVNGNTSPFTGLAEVAFDGCIAVGTPVATVVSACRTTTVSVNAPAAVGGAAATLQWRRNGVNLVEGLNPSGITASGVDTPTLTLSNLPLNAPGSIDVIATNTCGSATSAAITPVVCYANCDCSSPSAALSPADFSCLLAKYRAADTYADCDDSGGFNPADFSCFLAKYRAGCP
jgi:hypothetical protein